MSDGWNIALLGATGAVGTALLDIMQERQFPFGELFLLSSERSAGETVRVNGQSFQVSEAAQFDWSQAQLAFNLLPLLPDDAGSVRSERRLVNEVRKILRDEGLPISVSSVQAPIFYGHAQLVHLETLRPMVAEEASVALAAGEGLTLSDELDYPTPVEDASGNVALKIGCLRNDYGMPDLLQFWSVADNFRFGGALMAVLTAEKLMAEASAW